MLTFGFDEIGFLNFGTFNLCKAVSLGSTLETVTSIAESLHLLSFFVLSSSCKKDVDAIV
jgi:hypothetical protein